MTRPRSARPDNDLGSRCETAGTRWCGSGRPAVVPQLLMPDEWVAASHLGRFGLWRLVANALVSLIFVPVLRLVSYRRRDWLLLAFVPVWQWVVAYRVGYRAAILPLHDWPPRPDERLRVRRSRPGPSGS